jgi:phosphoglycerate dehydrogenase-like enzyme
MKDLSMRIAICYPLEQRHLKQIEAAAPGHEIVNAGQEGIAEAILEADIFCGHAKVPMPWAEVVRKGRLKWIQSSAAGLDHCLTPEVIASPIVVTSASGLFANQVAETTFALLLGLLRSMPVFFRAQEKREFIRRPTSDLHGRTVGIVGLGGNGRRIAEILSAFQTRILATDFFPTHCPPHVEALWPIDKLDELLRQAEILILTLPLNESTLGLINANKLSLLPKGAVLINVARGQVVVEKDLVAALQSGHLSGAGLDVTEIEPLPVDSPLWQMPQVMITPHVGAQSRRRLDDTTLLICENLKRYLAGAKPWNQVEKHLGFPRPENVFRLPAQ